MDNNKVLPFERNRYYSGKLLTANDFNVEQSYNGGKRRFVNNLMFGSGVVCGLSVYNLDDLSIIIESGVAIDNYGREIVLENSVVKKLSTIEGFDKLTSDEVELFIAYSEEETHPVFLANAQSGEEYQYNTVEENCKFLLLDEGVVKSDEDFVTEFVNSARLYQDSNYSVNVSIPVAVPIDSAVRIDVELKKLSDEPVGFNGEFTLLLPAILNEENEHELNVTIENVELQNKETIKKSYWVTVAAETPMKTSLSVNPGSVNIQSGSEVVKNIDKFSLNTEIVSETPEDIVMREIGKISLENRGVLSGSELVRIAHLSLIRTDSLFIISDFEDAKSKKYIKNNANDIKTREYLGYFKNKELLKQSVQGEGNVKIPDFSRLISTHDSLRYTSGILEIPLDVKQKPGDIIYSAEIMHGLGKGNVYVDMGIDYLAEDKTIDAVAENVVYGDTSLFESPDMPFTDISTAIKVMPDKGSFMAAVKLLQETDLVMLKFRWNAIKFTGDDKIEDLDQLAEMRIVAETPTFVLGTKESHFFKVKFSNMPPSSVTYTLTEENSGEISADGVYTAPTKEGVYEILITCVEYPLVSTYAYAVVKRKGNEE